MTTFDKVKLLFAQPDLSTTEFISILGDAYTGDQIDAMRNHPEKIKQLRLGEAEQLAKYYDFEQLKQATSANDLRLLMFMANYEDLADELLQVLLQYIDTPSRLHSDAVAMYYVLRKVLINSTIDQTDLAELIQIYREHFPDTEIPAYNPLDLRFTGGSGLILLDHDICKFELNNNQLVNKTVISSSIFCA